ncbi:MAG: ABC transporter permease [Clostridiales bacterium]|nr:ABC transporter permease [Clostridiales bacterium]
MRSALYPKIAVDGIHKNSKLYVPYIATCILMIAVFYIMHTLGFSDMLSNFMGAATAKDILAFGTYIMAIFGTIFLFYTQSALIKGRLKEFGLYSVLGMNRRNLGKVVFYETVITWVISMAGGLVLGVALSKLAELGLCKMIGVEAVYSFDIHGESILWTVIVYSFVFFLIYLNAFRQVRFSSAIDLIHAGKAGEKPPKANWVAGIIGLALLAAGYIIALKIEQPLAALAWFFIAVILVIIGTYLTLITGSVLLCRILQKKKNYYYKTNHFVSVSSMAYRMKRNGASLASICILLTMVLVMMSSTYALYSNREATIKNHYPRQLNASAMRYGYDETYPEIAEALTSGLKAKTEEYGAEISNAIEYYDYALVGYYQDGIVDLGINPMENITTIDYDNVAQAVFIDVDTYNMLTGENASLAPDEALVGVSGRLNIGDVLGVGDESFKVKDRIDDQVQTLDPDMVTVITTIIIIVDDADEVASRYADVVDYAGDLMISWNWRYQFDTDLDPEGQKELGSILNKYINTEMEYMSHTSNYVASQEEQRADFVMTFGGLFFLGILLSIIFLVSCVLIIYYKQISEGLEDQSRFDIMQKVGMTKENIKKSINSQMLTVFFIPIAVACMHLAAVLPIVHKLLMLFGHDNMPLLLISAGVCALVCGIFYAATYKVTSNAYYKIVS